MRSLAARTHCCSARWGSATPRAPRCCCIVAPAGRSPIASDAAPASTMPALERKRQLLAEASARCPQDSVAVRNAGGIRRLRARDDHRRDARSRTASLHRRRRRLRRERRGAARDRNGLTRSRALRLQSLLGGNTAIASCSNICRHSRCSICGLRLGEGSGAALAWPLIESAARLMTRDGELRIRRRRRPHSAHD